MIYLNEESIYIVCGLGLFAVGLYGCLASEHSLK
jgi:hypothetical protein